MLCKACDCWFRAEIAWGHYGQRGQSVQVEQGFQLRYWPSKPGPTILISVLGGRMAIDLSYDIVFAIPWEIEIASWLFLHMKSVVSGQFEMHKNIRSQT